MLIPILAGQLTGATSGLVTNSFALVKYRQWRASEPKPLMKEFTGLRGGDLGRGLGGTIARDATFGLVFTSVRAFGRTYEETSGLTNGTFTFALNFFAGTMGTVMSGPFNYCRNRAYASESGEAPTMRGTLLELLQDFKRRDWGVLNHKLRIGWGSLRVGIGMATGSYFYRKVRDWQLEMEYPTPGDDSEEKKSC